MSARLIGTCYVLLFEKRIQSIYSALRPALQRLQSAKLAPIA